MVILPENSIQMLIIFKPKHLLIKINHRMHNCIDDISFIILVRDGRSLLVMFVYFLHTQKRLVFTFEVYFVFVIRVIYDILIFKNMCFHIFSLIVRWSFAKLF